MKFLCKFLGCKEKVVYQEVEKIVYQDRIVEKAVNNTESIRPDPISRPQLTGNPSEDFGLVYRHYGVPEKPQAWVNRVTMDMAYVEALVDVLDTLQNQMRMRVNRLPVEAELHHFTTNTDAKSMQRLADILKKKSYMDIIQTTMTLNTPLCKCQMTETK